jgi:hypothetical protein
MDRQVPINVDLLAAINRLPMDGRSQNNIYRITLSKRLFPMKSRKNLAWIEGTGG